MTDEELQESIEKKVVAENSADAAAYQKVFDALSKEHYSLPVRFADTVMDRLDEETNTADEHVWLGLGVFCFVALAVVLSVLFKVRISFGSFKFISGYAGVFIFGLVLAVAFHFLERRLVKKI